nr:MAG TPA: actin-like protein [Caudoviricetes sp.]
MKKKPPALILAETQRSALLAAIRKLNKLQLNGVYILRQKGFAYQIAWAYDKHSVNTPITDWMTFQQVKDWIAEEKRCLL